MKTEGQVFLWILIFFFVAGSAFLGYLIYVNLPGSRVQLRGSNLHADSNPLILQGGNSSTSIQFYPRMRFQDRIIAYGVDSGCSDEKMSQVTKAFYLLEDKTSLRFVLDQSNPQIEVTCSQVAPPPTDKGHFVAGEGGPYEILNSSAYAIILYSKISLYRDETCSTPHIATHEILHALGFDHNYNPNSILYPTLDCKQTIDSYLFDELNQLYLEDSLPDLSIVALNGTKSGRYLSFSISVTNRGLKDSPSSNLSLINDEGSLVKDFELGEISLGATKTLTVSNLAGPRASSSFEFVVDRTNFIKELNKSNNYAELIISS